MSIIGLGQKLGGSTWFLGEVRRCGWKVAVRTRSNSTRNRPDPRKKFILSVSPIYLTILLLSYFLCSWYVLLFYLIYLSCKLIIFIFSQLGSLVKMTLALNQKPWLVTGCSSRFLLGTTPLRSPLPAHYIIITFCANHSCLILTDYATFELRLGNQD